MCAAASALIEGFRTVTGHPAFASPQTEVRQDWAISRAVYDLLDRIMKAYIGRCAIPDFPRIGPAVL